MADNVLGLTVALSISCWTGRKKATEVEAVVESHFNTQGKVGQFTKNLVNSTELADVHTAVASARSEHMNLTQPWDDQGYRYLSPSRVFDYHTEMQRHRTAFNAAVAKFIAVYDAKVAAARSTLGALFKDKDYPSVDEIKEKFAFNYVIVPIPGTIHNVMLDDITSMKLQASLDKENAKRFSRARNSIMSGLYEKLEMFTEKVSKQQIFRDTLVTNVCNYAEFESGLSELLTEEQLLLLTDVSSVFSTIDIYKLRKDNAYATAILQAVAPLTMRARDAS